MTPTPTRVYFYLAIEEAIIAFLIHSYGADHLVMVFVIAAVINVIAWALAWGVRFWKTRR